MTPQKNNEVAKWMESLGFKRAAGEGYYISYTRECYVDLVVTKSEAAFFYEAQQAAVAEARLEARLVELNLLEQALNLGHSINIHKMKRLGDLTSQLDALRGKQ